MTLITDNIRKATAHFDPDS